MREPQKLLGRARHRAAGLPRPDDKNALVAVQVVARPQDLVHRRSGVRRGQSRHQNRFRVAPQVMFHGLGSVHFQQGKLQDRVHCPLHFAVGIDAVVGAARTAARRSS